MNGSSTAAIMAISASTHTISSRVKPRCDALVISSAGQVFDRNIRRKAGAALLTVRSIRHDIVGPAFSGRAIQIGMVPGIVRDIAALEIWPVPASDTRGALYQGGETFCR